MRNSNKKTSSGRRKILGRIAGVIILCAVIIACECVAQLSFDEVHMSDYYNYDVKKLVRENADVDMIIVGASQVYHSCVPDVISELKTQMNLLSGCWRGPAWVAFQNQVADDLGNMSDVYRFLSTFTKGMSESAAGYLDAEKRNHSEIWRLWI